jgi:transposase
MGMAGTSRIIPKEIERELTPKARAWVMKLGREVITLRRENARLRRENAALRRENAQLRRRIAVLEAQVKKLKERQKATPQNSSVPPGTIHPHAKTIIKKPRLAPGTQRKKQGAQPGHPRSIRELVPAEACDEIKELRPNHCRKCRRKLSGHDPEPIRHQVIDIPPIEPIIIEYRRHRLTCSCGASTCADLPAGVPSGQCGPRLAAFSGLLMGHFRQSKRRAVNFLEDILNVPCSAGWMVKIQNRVSDALAQPYEELRGELTKQPQLFVDESPTKQHTSKAWLWVAVAAQFAVFGIFLSRKRDALAALIGNYAGIILNCDRAKMYFDGDRLQWCWAHLKRDIQKLIDNPDRQVKRLGDDLMRELRRLFALWRRYKANEIGWRTFQRNVRPIRDEFDGLVLRGVFSGNDQLIGMCDELYKHRQWLWTFTCVPGIEPTNNTAERALRPAVIYRKLSFGTQSASGSRYLERILTVSETCRLQNRSPFEYLVALMEANFHQRPAPSLLPSDYNNRRQTA